MSNETQFLIDSLVEHLTLRVMEEYGLSITEALSLVYNSQLYEKIVDVETGLYYQSASYNYNLLRREIVLGKMGTH